MATATIHAQIDVSAADTKHAEIARSIIACALAKLTDDLQMAGLDVLNDAFVGIDFEGSGVSMPVSHWDENHPSRQLPTPFEANLSDQRRRSNQVYLSVRKTPAVDDGDDGLHVIAEINDLGDGNVVPCVHVAMGEADGSMSMFRTSEGVVLRLETYQQLESITINEGREQAYLIR